MDVIKTILVLGCVRKQNTACESKSQFAFLTYNLHVFIFLSYSELLNACSWAECSDILFWILERGFRYGLHYLSLYIRLFTLAIRINYTSMGYKTHVKVTSDR